MKLLTPKATGEALGVSPITVLRLHDSGALPGVVVKQGARKRTVRFREEAVQRFISNREKRARE